MAETLKDSDWEKLLERIYEGKCTPFIGAGACAGTLPLGSEIARDWAEKKKYPLLDDTSDLARVAQFIAVDEDDPIAPREDIKKRFEKIGPPNFASPDEPHALLADLNLPIYITTNYDNFMTAALKDRKRDPKRELCRWNQIVEKEVPSVFDDKTYVPSPANPLVYHLHGHYDFLQSMVLTEDDYLNFLVELTRDTKFLPAPISGALSSTSLLFIGYRLSDWNFRVLFRGIVGSLGKSLGFPSVAVQLTPSTVKDSDEYRERAQQYLDKYFKTIQEIKVRVYWGDIKDFTTELRQRWEAYKREKENEKN